MKKDWEKKGFLEGLTAEEKEIIGGWFNQIDYDSIINQRAREVVHAVLRHIYSLIGREGAQISLIEAYPERFPVDKNK